MKNDAIRPSPTINSIMSEDLLITRPAIYIFKTNVRKCDDAQVITETLHSHFPGIEISFDLGDCDKVLRIKYQGIFLAEAMNILNKHGFDCEELLD